MSWPERDEDGFGPEELVRLTGVSNETLARISAYLAMLNAWRGRINLIGPGEGRHLWRRHVLDSAQLLKEISPDDRHVADLGSGAGFSGPDPGLRPRRTRRRQRHAGGEESPEIRVP